MALDTTQNTVITLNDKSFSSKKLVICQCAAHEYYLQYNTRRTTWIIRWSSVERCSGCLMMKRITERHVRHLLSSSLHLVVPRLTPDVVITGPSSQDVSLEPIKTIRKTRVGNMKVAETSLKIGQELHLVEVNRWVWKTVTNQKKQMLI